MADCGFSRICCPNECLDDELKEVFIFQKDLDSHLLECPSREFECPHCKEVGEYHEMTGYHLDECPQIEIPCPKKCKTEMSRGQLREHLQQTCPNVTVCCKYTELGCKECPLRKDQEEHEGDSALHLQLALDTIVAMKEHNAPSIRVFKMPNVERCRRSMKRWSSPPFYSHDGGYKMQLKVDLNRHGDDRLVVSTVLMHGYNDDELIWPFRGGVKITLLNQLADTGHLAHQLSYSEDECDEYNSLKRAGKTSRCLGLCYLLYSELRCSHREYLKDDSLFFRVSVKVHDLNKPWLNCTTPFLN